MRILHITDLHLTDAGTTLTEYWAGLVLEMRQKVDAVVVSGDITQNAETGKHNYDEVVRFLSEEVMTVLAKQERRRVIVVPGNHDVDWSTDIGTPIPEEAPLRARATGSTLPRRSGATYATRVAPTPGDSSECKRTAAESPTRAKPSIRSRRAGREWPRGSDARTHA